MIWAEQTSLSGVILADLKIARGAGSLVRLIRYPDHAATGQPRPRRRHTSQPEQRTTTLNPRTITGGVVPRQLRARSRHRAWLRRRDHNPTATSLTMGDGSSAEVWRLSHL